MKNLVVSKVPEMANVEFQFCDEADAHHKESLKWEGADKGRQYAHVFHKDNVICFAKAGEFLSVANQQGILVHEFGHLMAGPDSDDADADLTALHMLEIEIRYDDRNLEFVDPILG